MKLVLISLLSMLTLPAMSQFNDSLAHVGGSITFQFNARGPAQEHFLAYAKGGEVSAPTINRLIDRLGKKNVFGLQSDISFQYIPKSQKKIRPVFEMGYQTLIGAEFSKETGKLLLTGNQPFENQTLTGINWNFTSIGMAWLGFGYTKKSHWVALNVGFMDHYMQSSGNIQNWFTSNYATQLNMQGQGLVSYQKGLTHPSPLVSLRAGFNCKLGKKQFLIMRFQNLGFAFTEKNTSYSVDTAIQFSGFVLPPPSQWGQQGAFQRFADSTANTLKINPSKSKSFTFLPATFQINYIQLLGDGHQRIDVQLVYILIPGYLPQINAKYISGKPASTSSYIAGIVAGGWGKANTFLGYQHKKMQLGIYGPESFLFSKKWVGSGVSLIMLL